MRGFFLKIFSILIFLSPSHLRADQCVSDLLRLIKLAELSPTHNSRRPPIPLGLTPQNFRSLLREISYSQVFSEADVIVLYGSRTHFTGGYGPETHSDLDLAVFFENANQRDDLQLIDRNSDITQQLSSLSTKVGFSVAAQVPRLESFEEFLAHEPAYNVYDYHLSLKVLDFIAARGKMDRDSYRQLALKIQGEHWFNQEAIFIFRSKKNMSLRIEQLSRLGYRNFILLDESESVFHRIPA